MLHCTNPHTDQTNVLRTERVQIKLKWFPNEITSILLDMKNLQQRGEAAVGVEPPVKGEPAARGEPLVMGESPVGGESPARERENLQWVEKLQQGESHQ